MTHWLKVELIEETGAITARHFCSAPYGPEGKQRDSVVYADLTLEDALRQDLNKVLAAVIEANRLPLEKHAWLAKAMAEVEALKRNEFDDPKPADGEAPKAEDAAE